MYFFFDKLTTSPSENLKRIDGWIIFTRQSSQKSMTIGDRSRQLTPKLRFTMESYFSLIFDVKISLKKKSYLFLLEFLCKISVKFLKIFYIFYTEFLSKKLTKFSISSFFEHFRAHLSLHNLPYLNYRFFLIIFLTKKFFSHFLKGIF